MTAKEISGCVMAPYVIEDAKTRAMWRASTEEEAVLLRAAFSRLDALPPVTEYDKTERVDVLAQATLMDEATQRKRKMQVMRVDYRYSEGVYMNYVPRKAGGDRAIVRLPRHTGAALVSIDLVRAIQVDKRGIATFANIVSPVHDKAEARAAVASVGLVLVQGDRANEWFPARPDQVTLVQDYAKVIALTRDQFRYDASHVPEHMVSFTSTEGINYQLFRGRDLDLWIGVVINGRLHTLRRVIVAPPHHRPLGGGSGGGSDEEEDGNTSSD